MKIERSAISLEMSKKVQDSPASWCYAKSWRNELAMVVEKLQICFVISATF
ncbi:MAG: hypothetical protein H6552_03405 [Chitinophagales bacterium]|nr:hypothetical protein [Chitinophagales bacterium]